jgi:hypothetical protein
MHLEAVKVSILLEVDLGIGISSDIYILGDDTSDLCLESVHVDILNHIVVALVHQHHTKSILGCKDGKEGEWKGEGETEKLLKEVSERS